LPVIALVFLLLLLLALVFLLLFPLLLLLALLFLTRLHQFGQFHPQNKPSVQIHHTGKSHWVTSLQSENDSTVYVLDNYSTQFTLTPSLEIQFSSIYGQGKPSMVVKLPEVQQQTNGFYCGVYAIANLVEFCSKGSFNFKRKTNFIENYMRSHLISCLESGHFTPFPQSTTSDTDIVKVYTRKI
jgi:hypothetical protein